MPDIVLIWKLINLKFEDYLPIDFFKHFQII
jgi:hypothetical protein